MIHRQSKAPHAGDGETSGLVKCQPCSLCVGFAISCERFAICVRALAFALGFALALAFLALLSFAFGLALVLATRASLNCSWSNLTFAGHIAAALLDLTKSYDEVGELPWGTYNFCDSGATTWHMFATRIVTNGAATGLIGKAPRVSPILTEDYPTPAARPQYSVLNCQRFAETFPQIGIKPWQAGLTELLESLADNEGTS